MSYEGYSQNLCSKGHLTDIDANEDCRKSCVCGEKFVWTNHVNETNGSFEDNERIDGYVELEVKTQDTCSECGTIKEVLYKIPEVKAK